MGKLTHMKTIGNERARVTHHADGVRIDLSERGTLYQPRKRFVVVDTIVIPAAFLPFVREALAEPDDEEPIVITKRQEFIRVARHCPRCHAHHYHHVEHACPVPYRATINCAACGHRWVGHITAEEGGRDEAEP